MKNKGKRILSLLLVLVFVLSLSPMSFATGTTEEGHEPVPEVQTLEVGGEQPQSAGTPAESVQEVPAAQANSADSANSNQPAPTEGAAESVPVPQELVAESTGGEAASEPPVVETPAVEPKSDNLLSAANEEKTDGAQAPELNPDSSETGSDDVKVDTESNGEGKETETLDNSPAMDNVKEVQALSEVDTTKATDENASTEQTGSEEKVAVTRRSTEAEKTNSMEESDNLTTASITEKATAKSVSAHTLTSAQGVSSPSAAETSSHKEYTVTVNGVPVPDDDEDVWETDGSLTIRKSVEVSGTSAKHIVVDAKDDNEIIVTLKGIMVEVKEAFAGILVKANTKLKLILEAGKTNEVTGGPNHAGIEVEWTKQGDSPKYGTLTIDGEGTLNATGGSGSGGAGIGGSKGEKGVYGDITINGGTINATGTKESAGIGSSDNPMNGTSTGSYKHIEDRWGTITINGGNVTATGHARGAGIGGGNHSDSGLIVINDGTVTANGHSGIGSGYGSSQTESLTVLKKGPGYYYGDITINGGTVVATATSDGTTDAGGAGIGGGMYSDAKVTINGGNITATGGNGKGLDSFHHGGSGIGGGYQGHAEVTINGGNVTAIGGGAAAGIGSGSIPNENPDNKGDKGYKSRMGETTVEQTEVSITGGTVTALGGVSGGAGIGGGVGADNISVSISGGNVTATGGLSNRDEQNKGMRGGAGIGSGYSGINSGESSKYFSTTNVDVTIDGDANVVATGGWGAAGIGSGAANKTAETIAIDVNNAQVRAFSDGTKFAIDSRDGEADIDVAGDLLQATFVFPYDDGGMDQDPTGLKKIIVTNDKTGETVKLITESDTVGMLKGYRSFATTVSEAGSYTVYTDEKSIGQGGGRYFGKGETEVRDPARPLSEMTRYTVTNGKLSDNHFLFPVKSIVVTKVVVAGGGLDKSTINNTCYFALWDRSKGEYVQRDGKTWIESIDIVNGVPQSRAIFADVNDSPEGGYGIWEVDQNGREEGIIGMTYGSYELRLVQTRHGDSGDNDAEIDDDNWTDEVSVINTYFPVPDPDPTPVPDGPFFPAEEIDEDEVPLALGSLTNQLGECFD